MRAIWLGTLTVLGLLATTPAFAEDKLIIDINNPSAKRVTVAVPPLIANAADAATARKAADLLSKDLDFTGVFQTVPSKAWLADPVKDTLDLPQYKAWYSSGADTLVRGSVQKKDGGYTVEFRYFDTVQGKALELPGKGVRVIYNTGADISPAVHAFANLLMLLLTQHEGPFVSRIAYEYRDPKSTRKDLWVVNFDGSGAQALTTNNLLNLSPAWSPDGRKVVFTSYLKRRPDLYLMDIATGNAKVLSAKTGTNMGGAFSPDGKSIAAAMSFEGDSEIYAMSADGGEPVRLTRNAAIDVQPAWSPDGKQIAFTSDRTGNPKVFVMDASGANVTPLNKDNRYYSSAAWSPRGDWIAFCSRDDGNIWLTKADGSETKRLTNGEGLNEDPSWSPDGRYVVFSSNRAGSFDLWGADSVSGLATRLTDRPGDERNPAWGRTYQP